PDGAASHPALAVSPLDGSLTVAWVSEATNPASIRLRTRSAAGVWGGLDSVGAGVRIWTSPNFGVNVDQGPSLLIGPDGTRHLAYIEGYDATGAYGRVHYESQPAGGIGWTSATLSQIYSHHPTLAITGAGRLYLLGHGHSRAPSCLDLPVGRSGRRAAAPDVDLRVDDRHGLPPDRTRPCSPIGAQPRACGGRRPFATPALVASGSVLEGARREACL